jgi:hypothetical protein
MRLLLPEIFDKVELAKTRAEQKNILVENSTQTMLDLLRINFDSAVKMNLPEGEPPFKKDKNLPIGYGDSNLYKEFRKCYIWIQPTNLSKVKIESLFIHLLEGIHWSEAELVCAVKDKKLTEKYKAITEDLVRETFPTLLPVAAPAVVFDEQPVAKKRGRPKKS